MNNLLSSQLHEIFGDKIPEAEAFKKLLATVSATYDELQQNSLDLPRNGANNQPSSEELLVNLSKAERDLAKANKRISAFMRNIHSGILMADEKRRIIHANQHFCEMFGIDKKPEDLIGVYSSDTFGDKSKLFVDPAGFESRINELISKRVLVLNDELELTDGRILERDYIPVFIEKTYYGHLWMYRDISSRKKTESEVKRLALMASANSHGVVFTNDRGRIIWSNAGFSNLSGYCQEEIIGNTPVELLKGEETAHESIQKMLELFYNGRHFDIEILCYRKDGSTFWARAAGQSVMDKDGSVEQYFAVVEDITLQRQTQEMLKEAELRFRTALDKIGDNVWEHNFQTGITSFSKSTHPFLKEDFHSAIPNRDQWWDHTHPEDRHMLEINDRLYRSGEKNDHSIEYRIVDNEGNTHWVLDRGVVIKRDENNKPLIIVGTHTDITERKLAEQSLRINEEKYRSIIANMNLGLLEVDLDENILFANQSFSEMSGYPESELKGKKASSVFARGANMEAIQRKNELRKNGISDAYEVAVRNKRGQLRWWLISGAPRYNDRGELIGSIGIHLDISNQKTLEYELIEARELAEQSAQAKESFLANMSHEIRTPMNAIIGMTEQLKKTSLDGRQHVFVNTVAAAGEHLLVLINDILDISKIEAGKMSLEEIGFNMETLLANAVAVIDVKAKEKGISLQTIIDKNLHPVLLGDPFRVNQVLFNLLSNAVKFTEEGTITVCCEVTDTRDSIQFINLSVTDTGIGMTQEFQEHLFEKFSQADDSVSRKYGGTGLGMVICKQLTALMNGSITVNSAPGMGTTVTMQIPFRKGSSGDLPATAIDVVSTAQLAGTRILLAEDNEMNVLVAETILSNYKVELVVVGNGEDAVTMVKSRPFDIILMDMQMPKMDGLEATRILRTFNEHIPIIALSANVVKGESEKCLEAGMNGYLSKPYTEEQLIRTICEELNGKNAVEDSSKERQDTKMEASQLYDLSSLKEISRGNDEFLHKMISIFIDNAPVTFDQMQKAYAANDLSLVRSLAHRIKPNFDSLGINSIRDEIRQIEELAANNSNAGLLGQQINKCEEVIKKVVAELQHYLNLHQA